MTDQASPLLNPGISAVILAGGKSQRLGTDKALLELAGQPLLARAVHRLAVLSDDLIVVTNNRDVYEHLGLNVRFVPDEQPGQGALMGIYSGLKAALHDSAIAVACDMPFVSVPLLQHMLPRIASCDVVIPRFDELWEPLHALYGKGCLASMAAVLAQGRRQIVSFFGDVKVCYVQQPVVDRFDPLHMAFMNVNTKADWRLAQKMLERPELA